MSTPSTTPATPQILAGIKVLELGQLIAGPFCGKTLGDFGAEVIKIEPPGLGDPLRKWRLLKDGTSVWWQVQSRNKKSVDARPAPARGPGSRAPAGARGRRADRELQARHARRLGARLGAVVGHQSGLVMLRVSGFGQDGPYRDQPGFGAVGEAMGGLRYLTGEPGRGSVRCGISIGDTLAALHGTIGILLALYHRKVNGGAGQVIDVALYESVFNCMESLLPEFSAFGAVREASGGALPGIAPTNGYPCKDGQVLVAGNGDSIFKRLMTAIGRDDLGNAPDLANNDGRVKRVAELDAAIGAWTATRTVDEVLKAMEGARVPVGRVYTARDIANDPQYRARGMIQNITTRDGWSVDVPGVVPKLSATPGAIRSTAPRLGEDTRSVLQEAGLTGAELARLADNKVI